MEPKASRALRAEGQVKAVSSVGYGHETASTGFAFDSAGELVRIVSQLTQDVEEFDSMIRDQRHQLQQHGANLGRPDDRLLRRQSKRISVRAAQIANRTQGALDELRSHSPGDGVFSAPPEQKSESSPPNPS